MEEPGGHTVYWTRWWVLSVFSLFTFIQALSWGLWGPISQNAEAVYGWTDNTIDLLNNYGPIVYLPTSFFWMWLMDSKGLRVSVLGSLSIAAVACGLRCLAFEATSEANVAIHAAQLLNAAAGPVAMGAVGKLSEEWFPPNERTMSTGIASQSNLFGFCFCFLLGPYLVQDASINQVQLYMRIIFGMSLLCLVLVVVHFPDRPPTPPSFSAGAQHASLEHFDLRQFLTALLKLAKHKQFMLLTLSYGLCTGVYNGWSSILDVNLKAVGFDQTTAGWMGFSAVAAGGVGGMLLARFADYFRRLKLMIVLMFAGSAVSILYFCLALATSLVPHSLAMLYVSSTICGFLLNSTIPLFFELAVEITYPLPEATAVTMLTNANNLGGLIFLSIPVDSTGTSWMNWGLMGTLAFFAVAMLFLQEKFERFNIDTKAQQVPSKLTGDEQDNGVHAHLNGHAHSNGHANGNGVVKQHHGHQYGALTDVTEHYNVDEEVDSPATPDAPYQASRKHAQHPPEA